MVAVTIISIDETVDNGLFVVAEFRREESDRDPFLVESFHWKNLDLDKQTLLTDTYGRVQIDGKWVFPTVEVDGERVPRPDLDRAALTDWWDEERLTQKILRQVDKFPAKQKGNRVDKKVKMKGKGSRPALSSVQQKHEGKAAQKPGKKAAKKAAKKSGGAPVKKVAKAVKKR